MRLRGLVGRVRVRVLLATTDDERAARIVVQGPGRPLRVEREAGREVEKAARADRRGKQGDAEAEDQHGPDSGLGQHGVIV